PVSPTLARRANQARAMIRMAKLGGVTLSSFPDIVLATSVLKHNGQTLGERWGNIMFGGLLRGPLTDAAREAADINGAVVDGVLGALHSRFSATDSPLGQMAKWQDIFFRMAGQEFWTTRIKEG